MSIIYFLLFVCVTTVHSYFSSSWSRFSQSSLLTHAFVTSGIIRLAFSLSLPVAVTFRCYSLRCYISLLLSSLDQLYFMLYIPHPLSRDLTAFLFFLNCLLPFICFFATLYRTQFNQTLYEPSNLKIRNINYFKTKQMNENVICLMRNQNENHKQTNAIKKRIKLISQFKKIQIKKGAIFYY